MKTIKGLFAVLMLGIGVVVVMGQDPIPQLDNRSGALTPRERKNVSKTINQTNLNKDNITTIDAQVDSISYLDSRLDSLSFIDPSDSTATFTSVVVNGVTIGEAIQAFMYFGDSAVSLSYTTSWAHLTNTGDSLFIQAELDNFTVSNDTIISVYAGGYDLFGHFTHDGDNGETVSIRFYNVTQTAGIPVAGAQTCRAASNFTTTPVVAHVDLTAGDRIVVQYKGDANGTAVFKNAAINIKRIHD